METGKTAEYFPHDCNAKDDPKIMLMMAQLGIESYGIYWILVEYLRQQPGYKAPMILLDPLSRRYGSSKEKFEAVVQKFGLFESDSEFFFSPSLNRRMLPLEDKREYMRELALKRWSDADAMRTHNGRNAHGNAYAMQSKVKKSKVKKSKEEKSKEDNTDAFLASLPLSGDNPNQDLIKTWCRWVEFRKKLKKPYKTQEGTAAHITSFWDLPGMTAPRLWLSLNRA